MNDNKKPVAKVKEVKAELNHGEALKYYRNRLGYSQDYVGKKINVSQQQISLWEDQKQLTDDILQKFADLYEIGIIWLRDIPLEKSFNSYSQDGDGNINFQNNGNVEYHLNHPIKELEAAYRETVAQINSANQLNVEILKGELERKKEEIDNLWVNYNKLNNVHVDFISRFGDKIN